MSKINRSQLKSLIKECLIEILSEGVHTHEVNESRKRHVQPVARQAAQSQRKYDPRLDTPIGQGRQRVVNEVTKAATQLAGGDPMLESIFKDTAATTYVDQMNNGDSATGARRPENTLKEHFQGTPEEAFGDAAARWERLAFMANDKVA